MTLPNRCSCRSGIWNLARPILSRWRTAEWTCCVTTVEPYPVSTMAGEKSGDPACAVFPRFETSDDIHMMSPTHVSHPPASSFKKQVIGHVTRHGRQLWKCFANWIPLPWRINVDPSFAKLQHVNQIHFRSRLVLLPCDRCRGRCIVNPSVGASHFPL